MFTGIVQAVGRISAVEPAGATARVSIAAGGLDLSDVADYRSWALNGGRLHGNVGAEELMIEQEKDPNGEPEKAKKPYVAPVLVHLGSVRELTAGSPGSSTEGGFPRPKSM